MNDAPQLVVSDESSHPRRSRMSRKVRAILASGLVLGLGAAVTLAAWNDSEFAKSSFAAGAFNLQGSTDGTTYSDHATSGAAATLGFTVNPTNLSPTDVVYAPFAVRLDATTTYNANVVVSSSGTTGTVTNLTYQLMQTSTFGCSSGTTGTDLVPAGTALTSVPGTPTFALTKGSAAPGTPVYLCFKVTAGAGLAQSQTGTSTWQFTATSS